MSLASTCRTYGQNETLISSIRNIIKDYPCESIFREFLQNADDAGATRFHIIIDGRSHPSNSLLCSGLKEWQGPAILIFNNARFKESDFESLMQIRVGGKQDDDTKIGKHGVGFNSCYHFTDVPSFISGDFIAFLDPQEKYLNKRGTIGSLPRNGISEFTEQDQLVPFKDIEGIDFRSTFEGTLFRIPLRKKKSDISDRIFSVNQILELFTKIKSSIPSQFLFLRNVETIEISQISEATVPFQIKPLCKVTMKGLDETVRNKRKCENITNDEFHIFQIKTKLIDNGDINNKQYNRWIIVIGAQRDPEDPELRQYARRYRLRLLGGVAAPLDNPKDFKGRMYSFLSLPDTTNLPVHLNGTWAHGSDRATLLIEKNDIPDLDHLKLNWNRHILLDFLPRLHCKLLLEAFKLKINDTISKFWPFPSTNNPNYAVEYGFKVLKHMFQNENILINDGNVENNVNNRVEIFFKHLSIQRIKELRTLLLPNCYLGMVTSDDKLKSLVRLFPIWENYSNSDSEKLLKPASCGFLLHDEIQWYKTRTSIHFFKYHPRYDLATFLSLDVSYRDTYSYTLEDVEFPRECNDSYVRFLFSVLVDNQVVQGLRDKRCFPNSYTKCLKNITDLFDPKNHVFRTVFGGNRNSDVFLHSGLLERAGSLSSIGFNDHNTVNQSAFNKCADKIEELQNELEPPTDLIYRGFTLVDHLYKNINVFNLESIRRVPIFPIAKSLGKPHDLYYHHKQIFCCLKDVILPQYRDVAWSQMPLIAENVIPPPHVIQKHPSFGKPNVSTVVKHLRFLYHVLRINDEWKNTWAEIFKHNVFEVYKWLEEESLKEDIGLTIYIRSNDPLFLNFNMNQDPFNRDNWVTANDLVLNRELGEEKYVDPRLAKYPTMLKNAGVKEIKPPNFEIRIRQHDQSNINRFRSFKFLLDQSSPLNDITFSVNGENIKTSRYMLSSSSEFFHRKFTADPTSPITITVGDIQPNSMRILLRYLYSQDIDDAIHNKDSINIRNNKVVHDINQSSNLSLYKDLLKLADDYELDHLKEQMEFRISRLIQMSNAKIMKTFAETLRAEQLKHYCDHYIRDNSGL